MILWTPLLSYVCIDELRANKVRRYLMLFAALFVITRDIQNIGVLTINGNAYTLSMPQILNTTLLFVLIGYETYLNREWIKERAAKLRWIGLASYVIFCIAKFGISSHYMRVDPMDDYFIGIGTVLGFLSSYSLFIAIFCLNIKENTAFEKLSLHLGNKTLGIYLIHGCVFRKLSAIGVRDWFYTNYTRNPDNLAIEIV